jgi:hypothetical protein
MYRPAIAEEDEIGDSFLGEQPVEKRWPIGQPPTVVDRTRQAPDLAMHFFPECLVVGFLATYCHGN